MSFCDFADRSPQLLQLGGRISASAKRLPEMYYNKGDLLRQSGKLLLCHIDLQKSGRVTAM